MLLGLITGQWAVRHLLEMLPWDEWGRMTDAYDGRTGPDYDDLLDELAAVCAADDPAAVARLFTRQDSPAWPDLCTR